LIPSLWSEVIYHANSKQRNRDMKRSLRNIKGYKIIGSDGSEGNLNDFLFDDESWIIRYIEAGFREIERPRILIPRSSLRIVDWQQKTIELSFDKGKIESSPSLDRHATVSREYEKKLIQHYKVDPYWPYTYLPPTDTQMHFPPRPLHIPDKEVHKADLDSSLRSFREVRGYRIKGTDGKIGQVEDIIVDDEDWQIIYLIIDTSRWLPWSKSIILSINWVKSISFMNSEMYVRLTADQIKHAPEFDPSHPIDMDYEKALHEYYHELKQATS